MTEEKTQLTDEQKRQHIENGGWRCPYCGSNNVEGDRYPDPDGSEMRHGMECNTCGRRWTNIFAISDIEEE